MSLQYKNKVAPPTFSELINKITVTPLAPNNLLSDWVGRYSVAPEKVYTTKKVMDNKPTKKQLLRAKQFQRRSH